MGMQHSEHDWRFRADGAFTLIELLLVITIIGILAALILSALSSAKLKGQQIDCLSNVRQLAMISFIYSGDNGRDAAYSAPDYPGGTWMGTLMLYAQQKSIAVCPSAPLNGRPPNQDTDGFADRAWVRWTFDKQTMFEGSYGYNGWLYSDGFVDGFTNNLANQRYFFQRESNIQKPAQTPVFLDENWVDLWPLETDKPSRNLYTGSSFGERMNEIGRATIARHGGAPPGNAPRNVQPGSRMPGAINIGMADGRAQLVRLEDVWNYSWHLDWQTPVPRPP
jgi:prepilin-type N-terminal cleavage/methylation domain-containing protein